MKQLFISQVFHIKNINNSNGEGVMSYGGLRSGGEEKAKNWKEYRKIITDGLQD